MKKTVISLVLILSLVSRPVEANTYDVPEAAEAIQGLKLEMQEKLGEAALSQCADTLIELYDLELSTYLGFLDINFRSKDANSALTDIAIQRYAEYKKAIQGHFSNLKPNFIKDDPNATVDNGGDLFSGKYDEQLTPYMDCQKITDAYIEIGKEHFLKLLKDKTAQKKTALFVEKYQNINAEMKNLNQEIARMYGFFEAFENKLPGFLEQCVR